MDVMRLWSSLEPRRKKNVFAGAGLLTVAILCTLYAIIRLSKSTDTEEIDWKYVSTIPLGIENPDTQIALFKRNINMNPNPAVVRITTPKGSFFPDSLEPFRGLVHITNAQEALRFVRFRTSRKYCYNWSGDTTPQEIVSFSQYKTPEFADTGGADETGAINMPLSGNYGLLSDKAYHVGKFQPPTVKTISGGYRIERWVCIYANLECTAVQKWQEEVKPDGEYKCIVLKNMSPPKLPDTEWGILGLS